VLLFLFIVVAIIFVLYPVMRCLPENLCAFIIGETETETTTTQY